MDYNGWAAMQQPQLNPNPSTDPYGHLYNAQHSSYAPFTYYPHQSQNPSLSLADPQLALRHHEQPLVPDAGLRPPGIDSYPATNSFLHSHESVGFEGQVASSYSHHQTQMGASAAAAYYPDPAVATQNWAAKQAVRQFGADPLEYAAALQSQNEASIVPLVPPAPNPVLWNNNGMNPPFSHDAKKKFPKKTKVMQSLWCEVCKILCNSKDVFDRHISGKKHKMNLEQPGGAIKNPNTFNSTTMNKKPRTINKPMSGQMAVGVATSGIRKNLETKKRKILESGTTAESVRVCTICNVACNSEVVFNFHLAGKQHIAQASMRLANVTPQLTIPTPNPVSWTKPRIHPPINGARKKAPKKPKIVQTSWCELCKINCCTKDELEKHKSGKKHKNNLEKLNPPVVPVITNSIIGPKENPDADKGKIIAVEETRKKSGGPAIGTKEDLESKTRKVLQSGAPAEAVKMCTICNVVCNSETVLNFHLNGQKHAAMVNKQTMGSSAVTA